MAIEITGSMYEMTPKEAAFILEHKNPANRPFRPATVSQYAREMTEGRWCSAVTDAIGFTTTGELVNGQHRLSAVVESGVTVRFFIARNVPKEAFAYIDIGARRSISDRTHLDRRESDIVTGLIRVLGAGAHVAADPEAVLQVYSVLEEDIKPFSATKGKAAKGATACMRAALVMLAAEGLDRGSLLAQLEAYTHESETMTPTVRALHSKLNGRRARIASTNREEVFAESIKAFAVRTDKIGDVITEYRAKFGALTKSKAA